MKLRLNPQAEFLCYDKLCITTCRIEDKSMNSALSIKNILGSLRYGKLMNLFKRIWTYLIATLCIAVIAAVIFVMITEPTAMIAGGVLVFFFSSGLCAILKDIVKDMLTRISWRRCLKAGDLSIYEAYPIAIKPCGIFPTARLQLKFGEGIIKKSKHRSRDFYILGNRKSIQIAYSPSCDEVFFLKAR